VVGWQTHPTEEKERTMKKQFMQDLQKIYDELQNRQAELNSYYQLLDKGHDRAKEVVDAFLMLIGLEYNDENDENVMAVLTRIINLREDALEQVLQKSGFSEDEILMKKELAYGFASTMHITRHENFIAWVEKHELLTPFYRSLILGVHYVGIAMSVWQSSWTHHIINGVNRELSSLFDGDDSKVFAKLQEEDLLDIDESGCVGDRCYSVLMKDDIEAYKSVAYVEAFPKEVAQVIASLEQLIILLQQHEDEVFKQKTEWIAYFIAIEHALKETQIDMLISNWADVDRAWMKVTTPLQVGHPLEYYEDHYRKAVALEWDLRIVNPKLQNDSHTRENIKNFASQMAESFGSDAQKTMAKNLTQVDETQLYIGQPR